MLKQENMVLRSISHLFSARAKVWQQNHCISIESDLTSSMQFIMCVGTLLELSSFTFSIRYLFEMFMLPNLSAAHSECVFTIIDLVQTASFDYFLG